MFTSLHPPAKLHYVPIVQHDVRWSARVQMSNGLPPPQCEIYTFAFDILWSVSHHPTSRKNNKAVNCVVNENLLKNIFTKNGGSSSLFYIYIYNFFPVFFINHKFINSEWHLLIVLTSVMFLNIGNMKSFKLYNHRFFVFFFLSTK